MLSGVCVRALKGTTRAGVVFVVVFELVVSSLRLEVCVFVANFYVLLWFSLNLFKRIKVSIMMLAEEKRVFIVLKFVFVCILSMQ